MNVKGHSQLFAEQNLNMSKSGTHSASAGRLAAV